MAKNMTAGSNCEFLCMAHNNKNGMQCCPPDYCMHNLKSFQKLLTDRSCYCDRIDIKGSLHSNVQNHPQNNRAHLLQSQKPF
jgi:hypothetical protein